MFLNDLPLQKLLSVISIMWILNGAVTNKWFYETQSAAINVEQQLAYIYLQVVCI